MSSFTIQDTGQTHTFDILRVAFRDTQSITVHPVEQGVDVVDHIQERPSELVVEALISDTPLTEGAQGGVAEAEAFLAATRRRLLDFTLDGVGVFTNYALVTIARDKTNVNERTYTLRLQQVRFAIAVSVLITPTQTNVAGAPDRQSAGQQATEEEEVSTSLLRNGQMIFQALTGIGVQ